MALTRQQQKAMFANIRIKAIEVPKLGVAITKLVRKKYPDSETLSHFGETKNFKKGFVREWNHPDGSSIATLEYPSKDPHEDLNAHIKSTDKDVIKLGQRFKS